MGYIASLGYLDMNSANVWHFYHISRKKKYGPFSFEQLCSIFSKNNIQEDHILIFKNGWDKWRSPLSESIFHDYFKNIIAENEPSEKIEESNQPIELPNIKAELNVIVVFGKKSFKTKTIYIGDKTLLLKHNLPANYNQDNLSIYLKAPDNRSSIKLTATVLKKENEIIQFQIENEFSQKIFARWLNFFYEKSDAKNQTKKIA
jgi:hypothetical protein